MKTNTLFLCVFLSGLALLSPPKAHASENEEAVTFLGVTTERVRGALRAHLNLPDGIGLSVVHVSKNTAADKAGLKKYDILLEFENQLLINSDQLGILIRRHEPGEEVKLKVLRNGEELEIPVTLGSRKSAQKDKSWHSWKFWSDGKSEGKTAPAPPDAPEPPDLPGSQESRDWEQVLKRFVQADEDGIYIDLEELRADMDDLRAHLGHLRDNMEGQKVEEILERYGIMGNRRTVIRMDDQNISYSGPDGEVKLQTEGGKKLLKIKDPEGKVLYEGELTSDYEKVLSEEALDLLRKVKDTHNLDFELGDSPEVEIRIVDDTDEGA